MTSFPIVFSFRDLISGNGFVAQVTTQGRALLTNEGDGDWWIDGVQPAGFGAGGEGRDAALAMFKYNYLLALFDIAADTPDFKAFETEVAAFLHQADAALEQKWNEALARVRRDNESLLGLAKEKAEDRTPSIRIELHHERTATPGSNALPVYLTAA